MPNQNIFLGKFKFTKVAVDELAQILDPYLNEPNPNGQALTKSDQVLPQQKATYYYIHLFEGAHFSVFNGNECLSIDNMR